MLALARVTVVIAMAVMVVVVAVVVSLLGPALTVGVLLQSLSPLLYSPRQRLVE